MREKGTFKKKEERDGESLQTKLKGKKRLQLGSCLRVKIHERKIMVMTFRAYMLWGTGRRIIISHYKNNFTFKF